MRRHSHHLTRECACQSGVPATHRTRYPTGVHVGRIATARDHLRDDAEQRGRPLFGTRALISREGLPKERLQRHWNHRFVHWCALGRRKSVPAATIEWKNLVHHVVVQHVFDVRLTGHLHTAERMVTLHQQLKDQHRNGKFIVVGSSDRAGEVLPHQLRRGILAHTHFARVRFVGAPVMNLDRVTVNHRNVHLR